MKVCSCCGVSFTPKQNHPRYKYCSTTCKDKAIKSTPEYQAAHRARMKQHREQNLDKYLERDRVFYKQNKYKFLARNSRRRTLIKQATPAWANIKDIQDVYLEASYFGYHVDHIIPLRGKDVCGLHTWENLQVLSPIDNLRKGNKNSLHD